MSLPARRVRELIRLLREMREIETGGGDPTAHAAHGVVQLVGADAGGLVLAPGAVGSAGNIIRMSLCGYSPAQEQEVASFYRSGNAAGIDIAASALVEIDARGAGKCRRRRDLVSDRDWYRSPFVNDYRKPWRLDDSIYGGTKSGVGNYAGLGLFRVFGARPFSEEDVQLSELFAEGVSGSVFAEPAGESVKLSPRQRETLECLLTGDSAKQIASKLGLSIHTVGEYIKAVYRAHGVKSRAELFVRVRARSTER